MFPVRTMLRSATLPAAFAILAVAGLGSPALASPPATACNVSSVVSRALPAIVNITVVKVITNNSENEGSALDADSKSGPPASAAAQAGNPLGGPHFETFVGSGSIINPAGIIITNKHVIKDAALIRVTFHDKKQVPAQLIAAASLMDLAVLKVNMPEPLPTLQFGDSDNLKIGQPVIAVGNPLGLGTSVSVGVVSARDRNLMRSPFDDYIQTDATINPGNSGGPMLDCSGKMVGIDTALLSNSSVLGSIGIGFAIPANDAQFVSSKLIYPETDRPTWVGLKLQDLTARLATIFGRPDMSGAIVTGVTPGSPAAKAGVQPGDIIAGANGQELHDASAILRYIVMQPLNSPISLLVWRNDQMEEVTVRGQPWPHINALRSDVLASPADVAQAQAAGLGLHLAALNAVQRRQDGLPAHTGVLVDQVTPGSQADDMGIRAGDVIERIGQQVASTPEQVHHMLLRGASADGDLVALLLHDQQRTRWVTLYIGRVYVAGLLAAPILPGGFGPVSGDMAGP